MKHGCAVLGLALLLGMPVTLPQDGEKALEKAMLVERDEHDPGAACKLYEAITKDEALAAELRTRAWLRLGLCLRRLGKSEEAKAALEKAASGQGGAAQRAKDELAGKGDEKLAPRVREIWEELGEGDKGTEELHWLGPAVVPHLIRLVEENPMQRDRAARGVRTLIRLGGPEVQRFLESAVLSDDVVLRRAVAAGIIVDHDPARRPPDAMLSRLQPLCDDADATVRSTAAVRLFRVLPREKLIALARDPEREVRLAVIEHARQQAQSWQPGLATWPVTIELWTRMLEALLESTDLDPRTIGIEPGNAAFVDAWLATAEGQAVFLRTAEAGWQLPQIGQYGPAKGAARPDPRAVLRAARALGTLRGSARQNMNIMSLFLARYCWPTWESDEVSTALDLLDLGYTMPPEWVKQHARPADLPRMAALVAKLYDPGELVTWLVERGHAADCVAALRPAIAEVVDTRGDSERLQALERLMGALAQITAPEAARLMLDLVAKQPALWNHAYAQVSGWSMPEAGKPSLELLVLPSSERWLTQRPDLFRRCAKARVTGGTTQFAKAYEIGLVSQQQSYQLTEHRNVRLPSPGCLPSLFPRTEDPPDQPQFSDDELAAIVEACLRVGTNAVWLDVGLLDHRYRLPPPVVDVIVRHLDGARKHGGQVQEIVICRLLGQAPTHPAVRELTAELLRGSDDERGWVASHLDFQALSDGVITLQTLLADRTANVSSIAIRRAKELKDKALLPALVPLLAHGEPYVRRQAVEVVALLEGVASLERILPLFADSDEYVRLEVVEACRKLLDARAAPHLVTALRDDREGVRNMAKAALEAIRFHQDQESHWQRWLANQGARSAAEALMKQAGRDQEAKVRVAAIRSLGALGDKEALPFLVEMLKDQDAEVARAAEAAIARLTEGAKDGK